ncbi:PstS family phosphate ABC transporter substrate-binding protein [Terrimonas pollutisoli]|uniref:PstS family phosphate ABC transporter substrate-binding protein n=1 Tax=Terrimonas pollutisoli TaxID=3034147 RepID=UPI0023EC13EB|nr:substrate-binding domain-containing protein [Terrimonas sp. H1YJ31]
MQAFISKKYLVFILSCAFFLLNGCQSFKEKEKTLLDTPDRGLIHVSADESFKPIIDEQVKVYEANHPGTQINVTYKPEAECLKDMAVDSIRMIIATRGFSDQEKKFIVDSFRISPKKMVIARDAVAVIVSPEAEDSLFTMAEIKEILTGNFKKKLIPVFDGVQATSTVRFIVDSVLKSDSLTPAAVAARTSEAVIDYVAKNPQAIGFIGVSWIGNREDEKQISFLEKVKMVQLESMDLKGKYILPVQANIYLRRYPMVRDLVYILKEKHRGLGKGFADFMSGEIGQLIFKRAYLMPAQKDFTFRPVRVSE